MEELLIFIIICFSIGAFPVCFLYNLEKGHQRELKAKRLAEEFDNAKREEFEFRVTYEESPYGYKWYPEYSWRGGLWKRMGTIGRSGTCRYEEFLTENQARRCIDQYIDNRWHCLTKKVSKSY